MTRKNAAEAMKRPVPPKASLMAESVVAPAEVAEAGSRGIESVARYDGPKTPFERVVASKQGDTVQLFIL